MASRQKPQKQARTNQKPAPAPKRRVAATRPVRSGRAAEARPQPAKSPPARSTVKTPVPAPTTKQPATKQSATKQPATKQPATKQPATKQPATKQAAAKTPAKRTTAVQPAARAKAASAAPPDVPAQAAATKAARPEAAGADAGAKAGTAARKRPAGGSTRAPAAGGTKPPPATPAGADGSSVFKNFTPWVEREGESYMNPGQLEHFRGMLLRWRQELMEEVDRTVHYMQDEAANYADPLDRATQEEEFSIELRTRDRERKLIKKIDQMLERIDEDDFGYCDTCGVEIGIRRLEARPTATQCVDCKTLDEMRERQLHG
jgi:DnaK suppressor protein